MKRKKSKMLKSEKMLWILIFALLFSYPLLNVVTSAKLSETNIDVEKLKNDIEEQEKVNESISMQINELSSLDKIREIATNNGLSYKNNNIAVLDGGDNNSSNGTDNSNNNS